MRNQIGGGEQLRALRQIEGIAMPVQRQRRIRERRQATGAAGVGECDRREADFLEA